MLARPFAHFLVVSVICTRIYFSPLNNRRVAVRLVHLNFERENEMFGKTMEVTRPHTIRHRYSSHGNDVPYFSKSGPFLYLLLRESALSRQVTVGI